MLINWLDSPHHFNSRTVASAVLSGCSKVFSPSSDKKQTVASSCNMAAIKRCSHELEMIASLWQQLFADVRDQQKLLNKESCELFCIENCLIPGNWKPLYSVLNLLLWFIRISAQSPQYVVRQTNLNNGNNWGLSSHYFCIIIELLIRPNSITLSSQCVKRSC